MKKLIIILSALAIVAIAPLASAEDVSLHVSGGPAEVLHAPVSAPQDVFSKNKYNLGMGGDAKLLFAIVPNLSVGPSVAVAYLPVVTPDAQATVIWDFGATARLQGNRSTAKWSPFVDASGFVAKQGDNAHPAMAASVGLDRSLDETNTMWGGVFVGWNHTFQTDRDTASAPFIDKHDGNMALAGLSLSFDAPIKQKVVVETQTVTQTVTVQHTTFVPTTSVVVTPPVVVAAPVPLQLNQKVQFTLGSSVLDATAMATLDSVVAAMNATPGYHVVVEGKASTDGTANKNLVLSHARAVSVVSYLSKHGVSLTDVSVEAVGGVGTPGDTSNRSVDFLVLTLVKN